MFSGWTERKGQNWRERWLKTWWLICSIVKCVGALCFVCVCVCPRMLYNVTGLTQTSVRMSASSETTYCVKDTSTGQHNGDWKWWWCLVTCRRNSTVVEFQRMMSWCVHTMMMMRTKKRLRDKKSLNGSIILDLKSQELQWLCNPFDGRERVLLDMKYCCRRFLILVI